MRALLARVGADTTVGGGGWNAPVNTETRAFAYVPIPEVDPVRAGDETPYTAFAAPVNHLGSTLPRNLLHGKAHLDPDFAYLTYGDRGQKAAQIRNALRPDDLLVFYAAVEDVRVRRPLVYALIGLYVVDEILAAQHVPAERRHENAHTRREPIDVTDVVVRARDSVSGRLTRCLPIGELRAGSYRVRTDILATWGGLSHKDGYLQRSARFQEILDPAGFLTWFYAHAPTLVTRNN